MKGFNKFQVLLLLMNVLFSIAAHVSEEIRCGNIRIQEPFLHQNSSYPHLLTHIILCKSHKLYFRTSIGLFPIHSIDYSNKLIIVSHTSCSSTSSFVSPQHLSAGFPPPSTPNSLILFNCSNRSSETPLDVPCYNNNSMSSGFCHDSTSSSCSMIDDAEKLGKSFDPQQMGCTHYSRVYASSSGKVELGTRICFDIPDHVPNPCDQCQKRDGNCGAGLRCACHPKKCKDKVTGAALRPCGDMFVYLVFLVVVVVFLHGF